MSFADLPKINAALNGLAAILLVLGWRAIRGRRLEAHKRLMLGAFATSTVFLACYLTYHFAYGVITRFPKDEHPIAAKVYLAILLTHTVLAALALPLVLATLTFALRNRLDRHKRLARWTLPIWLYVSVTGVLIYFMLYHWFR